MIKCNAIHYKKTGALSSFAVRKRCSSCRHLYLLWVKIHFVHRLKLFKVKECGMTKNIIFWLWKCSECGRMDLSKTSLFLVGPVECELPKICLISYPFHSLLLRNRSLNIATPRVLYRSSIWEKVTHFTYRRSYRHTSSEWNVAFFKLFLTVVACARLETTKKNPVCFVWFER